VRTRRIGVFGGTFDPPHHGHLIVASEAADVLRLDLLFFVPAADPPHKPGSRVRANPEQRLRMLRAATQSDPRFRVDDLELRRAGPSYSVDTLRELRERERDAELIFLLGIDQFRALHTWRDPEVIASLAQLGVMSREGETPDFDGPYGGVHVPVSRIDLSSSLIREMAGAGKTIRHHVPAAVFDIITDENLYGVRRPGRPNAGESPATPSETDIRTTA
jgi:nicotinate-nucleotide adenylyltransferase